MSTIIHQRVAMANLGTHPNAIIKLKSGWVVLGDVQPVEGYCLLLPDPVVPDLNSLTETQRSQYLLDATRVGDAQLKICGAYRINYEIWGNQDPALHTHIVPRYQSELAEKRVKPIGIAYDWSQARKADPQGTDAAFIKLMYEFLKKFNPVT